jgi:hypothetical protein
MCERRHHTSVGCGLADFLHAAGRQNSVQNRLSSLTNLNHCRTLPRFLQGCFGQAILWINSSHS